MHYYMYLVQSTTPKDNLTQLDGRYQCHKRLALTRPD